MSDTPDMELSLGETTDQPSRDVTDPASLTVEGFNLGEWMRGLRPARHAITFYGRPDVLADIEVIRNRIREADAVGDDNEVGVLVGQLREAREVMIRSSLDIVVQASSEQAQADLRTALGIKEGVDLTEEQVLGWIAAHIVAPEGLDLDGLRTLNEISAPQVALIGAAVKTANTAAPGVPAPFSPASSSGRRARG